ncbi:MAG: cell division protein FtsZ [Candidatus Thorarchaeota archaeon]
MRSNIRCPIHGRQCSISLEPKEKQVFVIMPFREKQSPQSLYHEVIKKISEWDFVRVDENMDIPDGLCAICRDIRESAAVLCDLSGLNSNVFLETGMALGLGIPYVFLTQSFSEMPFDILRIRAIKYERKADDPSKIADPDILSDRILRQLGVALKTKWKMRRAQEEVESISRSTEEILRLAKDAESLIDTEKTPFDKISTSSRYTSQDNGDDVVDSIGRLIASHVHSTRICVVGCGGAGIRTVNHMISRYNPLITPVSIDTDRIIIESINTPSKILIGESVTKGLGAQGDIHLGMQSIDGSEIYIEKALKGSDLVFVIAGMGGGTGTALAPVVSRIGKRIGAAVVGIATMPTESEITRFEIAHRYLIDFEREVDTIAMLESQKLMRLVPDLSLKEYYALADDIASKMVQSVADVIAQPSLVNIDFADFASIIMRGGYALFGYAEASGPEKSVRAVESVLSNPLVNVDFMTANAAIINVKGDRNLELDEVKNAVELVTKSLHKSAEVIYGAAIDNSLKDKIRISLFLTGQKHG